MTPHELADRVRELQMVAQKELAGKTYSTDDVVKMVKAVSADLSREARAL